MKFDKYINKIVYGDCKKVMKRFPDESIDLIITDPPYLKEFLYTYEYLANECPRIMKRGASLLTILGHYAIPQVIKYFENKLKYRWLLCMNQFDGTHSRMAMGIEVMWKPVLWFVKDAYPQGRGFLRDGIKISGTEGQTKKLHKWQQDSSFYNYYIQKLSQENNIILDPYCGSGTTAEVCINLKRNFICIDNDIKSIKISRKRIEELKLKSDKT